MRILKRLFTLLNDLRTSDATYRNALRGLLVPILLLGVMAGFARGDDSVSGYCEQGGITVQVASINATSPVQASYPQCTVTVYIHGLSVASGTYSSGGTITGSTSQTCTLTFIGGTQGYGTVALTGTNAIAGGTTITVINGGQGFASAPTTATLGSGTASCSGTATIATSLGSPQLATIYSDNFATALANPFTSNTNGSWQFYAADGRYDVQFSGSTITNPFTIYDQQLYDWLWQAPGAAAALADTQARPLKNKVADTLNVRDYGARDDGSTDNTNAIQAALNDAHAGQTVYFPCVAAAQWTSTGVYKVTQQLLVPSSITLRGDDWRHCFLEQTGASTSQTSVLNLIGSDSVTITGLKVYAAGSSNMPATVIILGRYPSTGAAGHHNFHNVSFSGNVTSAVVYSIASEENSWDNVEIEMNNGASDAGTAQVGFYTATNDVLSICSPACTTSSNLSLWQHGVHIANFSSSTTGNNCVLDYMDQAAGDHVYRDGYCAATPGGKGATYGYSFHFVADPVNESSGHNYWVVNERGENGDGFALLDTGSLSGGGFLTGIHLIGNTSSGQVTHIYFANSTSHVDESEFTGNQTVAGSNPNAELDSVDQSRFDENFTGNLKFDTIVTNSWIRYTSDASSFVLTIPSSSFQNWIWKAKVATAGGPLALAPVASSLTNKAPINVPPGSVPGTVAEGDLWWNSSTHRLYVENNSTAVTYLESGVDTNNLLVAAASPGMHFDSLGRLAVSAGAAGASVSSCGSSPSVAGGNDNALLIQVGTGTVTSCTVTFAATWTAAFSPVCTASFQTGAIQSVIQVATTITQAVLTPEPSANMAGQSINLICFGHN